MRGRKCYIRARSNNEREGLGCGRYAALWQQFDWGKRRYYRHGGHDLSRRWERASWLLGSCGRRVLRWADPRVFYGRPGRHRP